MLPVIGDKLVADVRTRHVIDLVSNIRTKPSAETGEPLSSRTVYNIYAVISALFRDAKLRDLIEQTPCCLTERQLGPKRDKDPEWRAGAVFTRDEAETIISTSKIPQDRRITYGLELLADCDRGKRPRFAGATTTQAPNRSASCSSRARTARSATSPKERRPNRQARSGAPDARRDAR